jgi:hypothetical protein
MGWRKRIRTAVCALYAQTEREIFDIRWGKALSRFTEAERKIIYARWKQSGTLVLPAPIPHRHPERPYQNQYKCPYENKNCGEEARYCARCNKDYEVFLLLLNDDR